MGQTFTVGELEEALFRCFPLRDAAPWDRCGLIVGDRDATVTGVLVALDPTVETVREAVENGCNVLVTHHPAFLDPPIAFGPEGTVRDGVLLSGGAVSVYTALRENVALIAMHTNLDRSPAIQLALPELLGFQYLCSLEGCTRATLKRAKRFGEEGIPQVSPALGQISDAQGITLHDLACICERVFGRPPRVWGDPLSTLSLVGTCTGSASDLLGDAIACGLDCLIVGEVRYHTALDNTRGLLSIVELGHDVSELPLRGYLKDALTGSGLDEAMVKIASEPDLWWTL